MKKVILLDAHTIQTLVVAKRLKLLGSYVILFCESKKSYGFHTKYADKRIQSPSIEKESHKFHLFFMEFITNEKIDVIIPLFDNSAKYLSMYKAEISKYSNFIIPDYKVFNLGYDKNSFMSFCLLNNFPHPKSFDLTKGTIEEALNYTGLPALIKPNITYGARGLALVNSVEEAKGKIKKIKQEFGNCHLQEFIPPGGKQFLVSIFMLNNELINATAEHKIRFYPIKGGSTCFNQTVDRNDLIMLCFDVMKSLQWEGFAHFDLIEDPRNGVVKILELNPRVQGCIKSTVISDVDFTENILNASLNLQVKKYIFSPGNYLRYLGLDFLWFLESGERFKSKPFWFSGFFKSNHFLQDFSFDDPIPFIYGTFNSIFKQFNPKFRESKEGMN